MAKSPGIFSILFLASVFLITSCKKEDKSLATNLVPTPKPDSTISSAGLNQSAYSKAQDYYLWNTQLPSTFNPAAFADPNAVMTDIRQYSKEAGFSSAVDRWSFAMKKKEWDAISGGLSTLAGTTAEDDGDFGITVFFRAENDLRVRLAEPNSIAGGAGVRRGWRITKINQNTNINTSNIPFIIDNIYNAKSANVTFEKPDGTSIDVVLTATKYPLKQVYLDTIYNSVSGKTGYLVYNSFLGNQNQIAAEFARVFNKFSSAGVTNLVVDLRYNGGGYVSLQQELANYIVNSSATGGVMMKQIYNTAHSGENNTTTFKKEGSLNMNKVYFIVSRSTASASELLINNLKPYMEVKLVGPSNTHGKPVGYFPIAVGEWYVFPVSFKTLNKNGEGNYYAGISPDALVADGLDKDWGDISESSLGSVLRNISSNTFGRVTEETYREPVLVGQGNSALDKSSLKITVDKN